MKKAVLISIRPRWVELIASGRKTIEIRKTRPKLETPFKCYIYQTLPKSGDWNDRDGRVVGEFVCDEIRWNGGSDLVVKEDREAAMQGSCLSREELFSYLGITPGTSVFDKRCEFYGWHISTLKMYDKPKELSELHSTWETIEKRNRGKTWVPMEDMEGKIKRPPQSWCYVEELADV